MAGTPWTCNAQVPGGIARSRAALTSGAEDRLSSAVDAMFLSGRGFDRAVKVARTIADLDGSDRVEGGHMAEALSYRALPPRSEVVAVG